jgi:hypothetical protein
MFSDRVRARLGLGRDKARQSLHRKRTSAGESLKPVEMPRFVPVKTGSVENSGPVVVVLNINECA